MRIVKKVKRASLLHCDQRSRLLCYSRNTRNADVYLFIFGVFARFSPKLNIANQVWHCSRVKDDIVT